MVLFGGYSNGILLGDTWERDGVGWTQRSTLGQPPPTYAHDLVYEVANDKTYMVGGHHASGPSGETWEWDAAIRTWTNLSSAAIPTPRDGASAVGYSLSASTPPSGIMLFGGLDGSNNALGDMWFFSGVNWSTLTLGPGARAHYALAYDAVRQVTVLFGGLTNSVAQRDTWEWNGQGWNQRSPAGPLPAARSRASMSFDPERGVCVLLGGQSGNGTEIDDTWEWDGQTWTERFPTRTAGATSGHTLAFDPARRLTVAFGPNGTWDYGAVQPATSSISFSPGCSIGPSPALDIKPHQRPWLPGALTVGANGIPAGSVAFMLLGLDNAMHVGIPLPAPLTVLGSPQCSLAVDFLTSSLMSPIGGTSQSAAFPLVPAGAPVPTAFVGLSLFAQALCFHPATQTAVVSDAVHCVTGLR